MIRVLISLMIAVATGILNVAIIGALPFPFSEVPLFPIIIALALVLRARPTIFWSILIALAVTDLYRGAGFGIGIVCLVFLTMLGHRVSSEMVTHRSLLGCMVIGALVGALWSVSLLALTAVFEWWVRGSTVISVSHTLITTVFQSSITALVCAIVFVLLPRWWHARSPTTINSRGI